MVTSQSTRTRPKTWLSLLLVIISGIAMWAAFPFVNIWPLTFVSVAILVGVVDSVRPLRAWGYAALWAMVFFMPHISWMQVATDNTWIAWFALAGAQAFFVGWWGASMSALMTWSQARTVWGEALGGALLWVTFEQLRARVPFGGFPWGNVSYPQVSGPLAGLAPLGGEVLTSFGVVVIAILLRRTFGPNPSPRTSVGERSGETSVLTRSLALASALAVFLLPVLVPLPKTQQNGAVTLGVVQGNVEIPMAETFAIPRKVTGNHVRETLRLLEDDPELDMILWGENATDLDPRADTQTFQMLEDVIEQAQVPMLFGLMEYTETERYNWMAVWDPKDGLLEEMYGKQHPVPWGEYVPMREISEFLATASAQISLDMVAVDNPAFIEVALNDGRQVPIAIGICFEVAYEPLLAEGVKKGGEIIVIPTNNAHFQDTAESDQQLQMAQFRALEFSRSAVQVSTNGVSGLIRPDGSVVAVTGTQEAAHLIGSLPLRTEMTPFVRVSNILPGATMAVGGILSLVSFGAYAQAKATARTARKLGRQPRR